MKENKDITKAMDKLKNVVGKREIRTLADYEEKWERDRRSALDYATNEGLKQGLEQGKKEEKLNIVKKLLKDGLDLDYITKITDLTKEEILNIK